MAELSNAENTLLKIKSYIPFFSKLRDDEIMTVVQKVQFKKYRKNEIIFEQNSEDTEAFVVVKGQVNISVGIVERVGFIERYTNMKTVVNLPVKSVFGEMSAMTGEKRSARATAYDDETMLLSFKIDDDLNDENADVFIKIYKELIDELSEKLRKTNEVALKKKNG